MSHIYAVNNRLIMNSLFALNKLFLEQPEKHKRFGRQHFSIFYLHLLFSIWAMHTSGAFYILQIK